MHSNQRAIYNNQNTNKVVVKGRRFGLTSGGALYCIESLLSGRKKKALWVDTVNRNLDLYVERYFEPVLNQIPAHLWTWRQVKKEMEIQAPDGRAYIDFRSADAPESAEGYGYDLIFLNEAGIILKDESLWYNTVSPMTLDYPDCEVIIGGTPKGRNLFFKLAKKAQEDPNWEYFHYSTYGNPYLDEEMIDELADNMPEHVRKQEILAEFLESGGSVFRNIKNCIRGSLEEPMPGKSYKAGIDLARKRDYTVITILDNNNHLVAYERFTDIAWGVQKERIKRLLTKYSAAALVDSTGVGDSIFSDLQDAGLSVEPFDFTSKSKVNLIDNLIIATEQGEISFPNIPELISELELFEYDLTSLSIKYSAPAGFHDDFVISLALAYQMASHRPFQYTYHFANKDSRKFKSIFEMEKEYQKRGMYTRER